ncbi:MAG TPA: non-canonical purine NTP pyrophosphatase [Candidatus Saccharimonadales bacterium]|nr:non-canonical purine NTP pyrophosphatase [Candidatus Saccharimonadales bacterium]
MADVTFITGNVKKAEFLAKYLNHPVDHMKLELDELQSLDLKEIAEHKARQAFDKVNKPILVEDVSFTLEALGGKLPGPFIKWFLEEVGLEGVCRLADLSDSRKATTAICYVYFDGKRLEFFEGEMKGTVPDHPTGQDGFGFNSVFIPEGTTKTNAQMNEEEVGKHSLRTVTVFPQIKKFLAKLDKN